MRKEAALYAEMKKILYVYIITMFGNQEVQGTIFEQKMTYY
jgi:hypothetical protein